jgi:hypothetical protein
LALADLAVVVAAAAVAAALRLRVPVAEQVEQLVGPIYQIEFSFL